MRRSLPAFSAQSAQIAQSIRTSAVRTGHGNYAECAARRDRKVERVVRDRDSDTVQRLDHVRRDHEILMLHADFDVDDRHHRPEFPVRAEELILGGWHLADRNGDDAGGTDAFHTGKIATQGVELLLVESAKPRRMVATMSRRLLPRLRTLATGSKSGYATTAPVYPRR